MKVVVDTNVLVSFLTDRNPGQQARAERLFVEAGEGKRTLLLPQQVVSELVYVLINLYGRGGAEVAGIVRDLLESPGVDIVDAVPWRLLLDLWPSRVAAFGDAAVAAVALGSTHCGVATFDRAFVRELQRLDVRCVLQDSLGSGL